MIEQRDILCHDSISFKDILKDDEVTPGGIYIEKDTCDLVLYIGRDEFERHISYPLASVYMKTVCDETGKKHFEIAHEKVAIPALRSLVETVLSEPIEIDMIKIWGQKPTVRGKLFDVSPTLLEWYEECRLAQPALPRLEAVSGLAPAIRKVDLWDLQVGRAYVERSTALKAATDERPCYPIDIFLGQDEKGKLLWLRLREKDFPYNDDGFRNFWLHATDKLHPMCEPILDDELYAYKLDINECPRLKRAIGDRARKNPCPIHRSAA